jgi:ribA/ribD-fused uncharacterized protein
MHVTSKTNDMDWEQLKLRARRGERFDYLLFWGHSERDDSRIGQSCLSQWYPAAFSVEGVRYATSEHWMMAGKARLFGDHEALQRIVASESPSEAKKLGGLVRGFDEQRWRAERSPIVVAGNAHKFAQNPALAAYLRGTGSRVLVEASPVDRIWGIGLPHSTTLPEPTRCANPSLPRRLRQGWSPGAARAVQGRAAARRASTTSCVGVT